MRRITATGIGLDAGYTFAEFVEVRDLLGPIPATAKVYTHNEFVKSRWHAWVCRGCGLVKLEVEALAAVAWLCELCVLKGKDKVKYRGD